MLISNYNVSNEHGALFFNENFRMNDFSMHFDVNPNKLNSEFGHLDFDLEECRASLYFYGHLEDSEDLSVTLTTYDLHDFDCGDEVLEAFHRYNLSGLYHAAERFTFKTVNHYLTKQA